MPFSRLIKNKKETKDLLPTWYTITEHLIEPIKMSMMVTEQTIYLRASLSISFSQNIVLNYLNKLVYGLIT